MARTSQCLASLTVLLSGILFGMGLTIAEMVNPEKVLGFLNISGNWDPSLALVMASALLIGVPAFRYQEKLKQPVCSGQFSMPVKTEVDTPLILGAVLFGVGWGLVGLCPGPVVASLWSSSQNLFWFALPMLTGIVLGKRFKP